MNRIEMNVITGEVQSIALTAEEIAALPPPPPPVAPVRRYTFLQFINLFTDEEQLAIVTASMSVPQLKLWYDKAVGAEYIDLDDTRTTAGINALVPALLTAERAAAILASPGPA